MASLVFQLLKYFGVLTFIFNYSSANEQTKWKIHTLPVYAMLTKAEILNSTQCRKDLIEYREAVDQNLLWSLKIIDASGEPTSGFIYGNNYWLGSKDQCQDAENRNPFMLSEDVLRNNSKYRHIEDDFLPFEVKYFVANFRHNSTLQYHFELPEEDLIILGMCLPASCSKNQLSTLLEILLKNRTLFKGELYSADFTLIEVRDLIDDHRWLLSGTFITMTIIVALTFLLIIIGTSYDVLIFRKRYKKDENYDQVQVHFIWKMFLAFSAYSNTKKIFNMKSENAGIPVIHGLKSLTMIIIILSHTFYYSKDFVENRPIALRKMEEYFGYTAFNLAFFSVDTFFCIGGFLVTYLYLKKGIAENIRKQNDYLNIIKLYFLVLLKRFIRLTPTFMILIGLLQINTMWYSKTSLFPITERYHENCPKYWWRNILYINNFFSLKDTCMSWSWYLANDMQYFVIINFLLFLSSTYFKAAASLFGLLFTSSIILTGYISYIYHFIPTMDNYYKFVNEFYYAPWVRIGPYLVGVMTAYIVVKLNNKLLWKKKTIILFWILASLCNLLVLFGLYGRRISVLTAAIYVALSRTVWAIGIAWLLIACCTNNGGIVNSILSWKYWIPFSRLTFAAYLINPFVIYFVNFLSESTIHVNIPMIITVFLGYTLLVYINSYMVSLMFELPYIYMMKEVMDYLNIKI